MMSGQVKKEHWAYAAIRKRRLSPKLIRWVQKEYGEPQRIFCQRFGVTQAALEKWIGGYNLPSGSAQILFWTLADEIVQKKY